MFCKTAVNGKTNNPAFLEAFWVMCACLEDFNSTEKGMEKPEPGLVCIICERRCDFCEQLSRHSRPVYLSYESWRQTLQFKQKLSQVIHRKLTGVISCNLFSTRQLQLVAHRKAKILTVYMTNKTKVFLSFLFKENYQPRVLRKSRCFLQNPFANPSRLCTL